MGIGIGAPAPVAVVRPVCPGPGYVWVNGYYAPNGVWVAGYWAPRLPRRAHGPIQLAAYPTTKTTTLPMAPIT